MPTAHLASEGRLWEARSRGGGYDRAASDSNCCPPSPTLPCSAIRPPAPHPVQHSPVLPLPFPLPLPPALTLSLPPSHLVPVQHSLQSLGRIRHTLLVGRSPLHLARSRQHVVVCHSPHHLLRHRSVGKHLHTTVRAPRRVDQCCLLRSSKQRTGNGQI